MKERLKRSPQFMKPTPFRLPRRKGIVVYDIESKAASPSDLEDSQKKGFERAFQSTLFDGQTTLDLRNEITASCYPWALRAISPGGCLDKLYHFLLQPKYASKHVRVYAHNGGKFDHLFMFYWLKNHEDTYRFEVVSVQSKIQRLDVWRADTPRKKLSWSFVDSLSLVPLSLEEAGKTLLKDTELKKEFDLDTDEHDPRWSEYGVQDVRTAYHMLEKFHTLVESLGGEVGLTAPSTALRLFQRRYLKDKIYRHQHWQKCDGKCHDDECPRRKLSVCDGTCHGCLHTWIFKGYVGGRSEPYKRRGTNLLYYDINSSYPRAMLEPMPVGKRIELDSPTEERCRDLALCGYVGFVECTVIIPDECKYPPLPSKRDGKLLFVTGRFSGIWSWAELQLLKEPEVNGQIVKYKRAVFYEARPIFAEMVKDVYAYRDKHRGECENTDTCKGCKDDYDEGMSFVAKLILNSLYGKFGMSAQREAALFVPAHESAPLNAVPLNGCYVDDPELGEKRDVIWKVPYFVDVDYMIPQIAAYITSLARIRLYRGMLYIIRQGGSIYYLDTDAFVSDKPMPTGSRLGQWKREHDYGKRLDGDFLLPKLYRLSQHDLDCVNPNCKGCAMVYHHPSCPKPKAAKAKDCKHCNRSASIQHMKGVPGKRQTSDAFDMFAIENDVLLANGGKRPKDRKPQSVEIERVSQHRSILRSLVTDSPITGPRLITTTKAHRSVYDKRFMLENGDSIPFRVWEDDQ